MLLGVSQPKQFESKISRAFIGSSTAALDAGTIEATNVANAALAATLSATVW